MVPSDSKPTSLGMLRYAGRESEGILPWEVGVGDFKTLIINLRDRAEAEIIFYPADVASKSRPFSIFRLSKIHGKGAPPGRSLSYLTSPGPANGGCGFELEVVCAVGVREVRKSMRWARFCDHAAEWPSR